MSDTTAGVIMCATILAALFLGCAAIPLTIRLEHWWRS